MARSRYGIMAALAACVLFCPRLSWAEAGFALGVEATTLFEQKLKLVSNPTITRTNINNLTSVASAHTGDYFLEVDSAPTASTTFIRSWDKLATSANYVFIKGSYSTEFFEAVAKVGGATRRIERVEISRATRTAFDGSGVSVADGVDNSAIVEMTPGMAYGIELRGSPYQTDDFQAIVGLRFGQAFNKGETINSSVKASSGTTSLLENIDFEQMNYGVSVTLAAKLGIMHPYLGLAYDAGLLKVKHTFSELRTVINGAGATTASTTSFGTLDYRLKPKSNTSLLLGVSFPFERGGISVEGRYQGESSMTISGFVAF